METVVNKDFLTIGESIATLGTSKAFVFRLLKKKKLRRYKLGGRTFIKRKELMDLFEAV